MGLNLSSGPFTTVAANQPLTWSTSFAEGGFVGPIAVAANFLPGDENFGTLTSGLISVEFDNVSDNPDAYNPGSFKYVYTVTNGSSWPLTYNISIGTFQ